MEKMRIARNLEKQIKREYSTDNGYLLAKKLVDAGYIELTDDIRDKISFLKQICQEVKFDDFYATILLAELSLNDLKKRYSQYVKYTGEMECTTGQLGFDAEKIASYVSALHEMRIDDNFMDSIMKSILKLGCIAKSVKGVKAIIADLNIFEQPIEIRNQFICENADLLFNDYSRKVDLVFEALCQKYGKEDGFNYLKAHPECIYFGINEIQ